MDATHEIDQVIDMIKDGKWHTLKDVNNKSKLPKPRTIKILEFLANYNFIYIDKEHQKVKVTAPLVKFLKENSQTL